MKKIAIVLLCLAALSLTACTQTPQESQEEHDIRMGKICADNGGSWTWNDWTGYHCDIKAKP